MSNISRMTGTPWHVGRYERQEGDERRHRSRCRYYTGKGDGQCKYFFANVGAQTEFDNWCKKLGVF